MNRSKKTGIIAVGILLFFLMLAGCGEAPDSSVEREDPPDEAEGAVDESVETPEEEPPVGIFKGNRAPEFVLTDMDHQQVQLDDFRGRWVIVNFWHLGCPYCLQEKEVFQAFYDTGDEEDAVILSINFRDSRERVEAYLEEHGYTFPVLFDTENSDTVNDYRVRAVPTSVFVDPDGLVQHRVEGAMTLDFIRMRLGLQE